MVREEESYQNQLKIQHVQEINACLCKKSNTYMSEKGHNF